MVTCSKPESSKSSAVSFSTRVGLKRQLRFIDKTRRLAGCANEPARDRNLSLMARPANAALLDLRNPRRSIMARDYKGRSPRNRMFDLEFIFHAKARDPCSLKVSAYPRNAFHSTHAIA